MKIKKIQWGDPQEPNKNIGYNHVVGKIGYLEIQITWKGHKEMPSYDIAFMGISCDVFNYPLFGAYSLEEAKEAAQTALEKLCERLVEREDSPSMEITEDADEEDGQKFFWYLVTYTLNTGVNKLYSSYYHATCKNFLNKKHIEKIKKTIRNHEEILADKVRKHQCYDVEILSISSLGKMTKIELLEGE